jgi:pimeloyl-ACP methyl ester carboxylesterase
MMKTILYTVGLILPIVGPVAPGQVKTSGAAEGYAAVNGAKLYYEIRGQGHPLVLIHGGFMDRRMWDGQFDLFAQKYKVIRYDVRGYEKSDKAAGSYSHVEDLRRLLDFLGVEKAYVLGLSLGGQIAIDFALEHPDRVDSLILVGAAMTGYPFKYTADFIAKYTAVTKAAKTAGLDEAVEKVLQLPFFIPAKPDSEFVNRMRPMIRENFRAWNSSEGQAVWPNPPAFKRIEKIAVPTLIILGDKDIQSILDVGETLAARIKGSRKEIVHDAAHHVNMEQPAAFNRLVLDFLAGL